MLGGGAGTAPTSDSNLDDGATTANTLTYAGSGGLALTGSSHGITIPAGTAVSGASGKVVISSDATNGYLEANENNTGASRVCTAANGVCPQGTVTSVTGTSPIVSSGGATPAISINTATSSGLGAAEADGTTLSVTSGVFSVNLAHANTWTANQTFNGYLITGEATKTSSYTGDATADSSNLIVMNCSSSCTYTFNGSPSAGYTGGVVSIGSTVATVSLNSKNFNGSSSVPVLISYEPVYFTSDGTNYFGNAPLVASTNVTFTPAANGLSVSASASGSTAWSAITNGANTQTGAFSTTAPWTFSVAGAASTPGMSITGAPYTGGSTTTNFPQLYLNDGTGPSTFSANGTEFGMNSPSGFTGNFEDAHVNGGASVFSVNYQGNGSFVGTLSCSASNCLGSDTATTQTAGDDSTKVATTAYTNTAYNLIETSGSPLTMSAISGLYWNNSTGAYSFDLPTPAAGYQFCFGNYKATAHAISLIPGSGVTIYFEGVAGTAGSSTGLVSGGAAGDYICLVGGDTTTYMAIGAGYGTWTNH